MTTTETQTDWLDYRQAAAHLGVSERTLARWVEMGLVKRVKFPRAGGRPARNSGVRFSRRALDRFMEARNKEV